MRLTIILLFLIVALPGSAQKRGNNWTFGDSAGINFNVPSSPITFTNSTVSRGTTVSISDTSGSLQFYAHTVSGAGGVITGKVWNKNHQLMAFGDSVAGGGWYHEMVILPDPVDDSLFYLFSIGVSFPYGLKYSKIDLRGDNGLGEVVQKNTSLLDSIYMVDGLTAVKHGNGRDWWLVARKWSSPGNNNEWYIYLITTNGITALPIQSIGSFNNTNSGRLCFNSSGSKMCFINYISLIELYDFDRCTGIVSNPNTIEPEILGPYPGYWTCQFSPDGRFLYVGASRLISKLYQFDTWAPIIDSSKTLLWQTSFPHYTMGDLKLAPDNKIYLSMCYVDTFGTYFPYLPTMYNSYNMNLSVINSPDSAGIACDFQPYSFSLGGNRTYWGLPNNPDYDLGPLAGSPCDTLVSLNELAGAAAVGSLHVYYHTAWDKAFIKAEHLKGKAGNLLLYNLQGQLIHEEPLKIQNGYYTKDLSMIGKSGGMYLVVVQTEKERLTKKFVK